MHMLYLLAGILLLPFGAPAEAQDRVAVARPIGTINEHFDANRAQMAGGVLVGLRIGPVEGLPFDPSNVEFGAPGSIDEIICVRGITQDGLYWTRTPYRIEPSAPQDVERIRLSPFTEAYREVLDAYEAGRMALLAFSTPNARCHEEKAVFLPETTAAVERNRLLVRINSGNRKASVRLDSDEVSAPGTCRPIKAGGRVAYNFECDIIVPSIIVDQTPDLVVTLDNRLKPKDFRYRVRLPDR